MLSFGLSAHPVVAAIAEPIIAAAAAAGGDLNLQSLLIGGVITPVGVVILLLHGDLVTGKVYRAREAELAQCRSDLADANRALLDRVIPAVTTSTQALEAVLRQRPEGG